MDYREKLRKQIKESYGRVEYSYTVHLKNADYLRTKSNNIKFAQIILSGVSSGGLLGLLFSDSIILKSTSAVISTILFCINLYFKNYDFNKEIEDHIKSSNELWKVRERYVSLLTDFEKLSDADIRCIRDKLTNDTSEVYKNAPKTNKKSYKKAKKALKNEEEQYFAPGEIDHMSPEQIRER